MSTRIDQTVPYAQQGYVPPYAYAAAAKPPRTPYAFGRGDAVFAVACLALGFLFWEWNTIAASLSCFLFFLIAIACAFVYLHKKGIRQNAKSLAVLGVALLGDLPFLLYDRIEIHAALVLFEFAACLLWLAFSCRTTVSEKLSGFLASDLINQGFAVSFGNFFGLFGSIRVGVRSAKGGGKVLAGIVGVIVAIPVIAIVISLLVAADSGFESFAEKILEALQLERIGTYTLEFVVGLPVACYLYGAVYGNTHGRNTSLVTKEKTSRSLQVMHVIPRAAVYVPVTVLCLLYVLFFAVMAPYLFSAFGGDLPAGYTYSEYARRGFFELCGVAAINLGVLIFTYLFARRAAGEYPKPLRILTGALSVLTALLIVTAVSKMFLYIGAYGLSQLRLYTLWFMVLLLLVFVTLIVWHVRPFNAGRPIVLIAAACILVLFLTNTDGLIAKYNTENYLNGNLKTVDTEMMSQLSAASLPYLYELEADAPDAAVRAKATRAIRNHQLNYDLQSAIYLPQYAFHDWNIEAAEVVRAHPELQDAAIKATKAGSALSVDQ
ncbi:MAG: DUF4173 domain-containing protein [Clostridiales Family XIII bacterium]|jgi:hypothetical protein|nr:DUF4173 domain-containing protein [Clostridiales Family XIII bacterium]